MNTTEFAHLEPKLNNRYSVEFPENFKIPTYLVCSVTLPKLIDNSEWSVLSFSLYDFISPSTSQMIMDVIRNMNADFDKGKIYELKINSLDPVGVVIEKWSIQFSKFKDVDFGNYSYSDDNLKKITIHIKPINCILNY
jgi:hypothetical protein